MLEINKRLVEVYEVINNMDRASYEKIPINIINLIKNNKDINYQWKYDNTKDLISQNLPHDTIVILSYLNLKYLLNEKQIQYFKTLHYENEQKMEKEKMKKYNPNFIFNKKERNVSNSSVIQKKNAENLTLKP